MLSIFRQVGLTVCGALGLVSVPGRVVNRLRVFVVLSAVASGFPSSAAAQAIVELQVVPSTAQIEVGMRKGVLVTAYDAGGNVVPATDFDWINSNPEVVRVKLNPATPNLAYVVGVAPGLALVSVTAGAAQASLAVSVTAGAGAGAAQPSVGQSVRAGAAQPSVAQSVLGSPRAPMLTIGSTTPGTTSTGDVASYEFNAPSAGVLTVAVRATSETDLVLLVTDTDGQTLSDGRSDQDLGGDSGAEQLAITLPRAGKYSVRVRPFSSGLGEFRIGASWLEFPELEQPADPDGSPSTANPMAVGKGINDTIDPSAGDYWDWFSIQIGQSGQLRVTTQASEGDLVLESFNEGEFAEPVERSDQDLQEVAGNEAIVLDVTAGQMLYFKVSAFLSTGQAVAYRLTAGLIQD